MPEKTPDILTLTVMFLVSIASGVVGILNKITSGREFELTWVVSEVIAAILCGYIAYDSYSVLPLPEWIGQTLFVATCSYSGGATLRGAKAIVMDFGRR